MQTLSNRTIQKSKIKKVESTVWNAEITGFSKLGLNKLTLWRGIVLIDNVFYEVTAFELNTLQAPKHWHKGNKITQA